jgi:D-alanine-D-alanine ligase
MRLSLLRELSTMSERMDAPDDVISMTQHLQSHPRRSLVPMSRKRLHIALVYNTFREQAPENPHDRGGMSDLRAMIRRQARGLRKAGFQVTVLPLASDLLAFQRRLRRLMPDVVFNQYDDVVYGAKYEMRLAAVVRMMGFPITGSPALALGLCREKYSTACLLAGQGIPIPGETAMLTSIKQVDERDWQFPLIVQASQEHCGLGLDRNSVVHSKKALREKVRQVVREFNQPALAQKFLPGREFNVGLVGGNKLRVMPLAEVDYSKLPDDIPPIMSYAAKNMENTVEYKNTSVQCPAHNVEPEVAKRIGQVAARAFRAVGGWGYGRVDIRLDEEGNPKVLDINCNPLLDEGVGLARSAERAGLKWSKLLKLIVDAALERMPGDVKLPMLPSSSNGMAAHQSGLVVTSSVG